VGDIDDAHTFPEAELEQQHIVGRQALDRARHEIDHRARLANGFSPVGKSVCAGPGRGDLVDLVITNEATTDPRGELRGDGLQGDAGFCHAEICPQRFVSLVEREPVAVDQSLEVHRERPLPTGLRRGSPLPPAHVPPVLAKVRDNAEHVRLETALRAKLSQHTEIVLYEVKVDRAGEVLTVELEEPITPGHSTNGFIDDGAMRQVEIRAFTARRRNHGFPPTEAKSAYECVNA